MNTFNKVAMLSLLGLTFSGAACAQGWYVGLDLATSKMDLDGAAQQAYDAKIIDDQLDGGSLIVGYHLNHWLAIEGGLHAQQMSQLMWVNAPGLTGFTDTTIDTRSISLAAKLSQPLAWGFSAYAKPGIAYTRTEVEVVGNATLLGFSGQGSKSATKSKVHPNLEVGLDYAFNDHFSAGIGYERQFDALSLGDEHYSLDTFKLGLRYHF
ncbi:TPA: porin family protein [Aeromonas veronii]|uniref:porin family protein n=1 Tax=Aeromonas veronii TaxID=654 RepID=UPI003309E12E|nr:porin family protein [Aeromonas veronii]HDO1335452.1 porin family protein [Aeromonas veronii]HDO1339930.1 porin family protein [Aeromonas veronii]HDO1344322.1 porin family protein [Aeromonas veronii]HDO1348912.1 porin family protein [Aeromonas veronii]